jgi:hypothetical protein
MFGALVLGLLLVLAGMAVIHYVEQTWSTTRERVAAWAVGLLLVLVGCGFLLAVVTYTEPIPATPTEENTP